MRVALVNPYAESLSWFFYSQGMATPPVGMVQVATRLAMAGHDVRVFDGQARYEEQRVTLDRVLAYAPDVVGIGTTPLVHLYSFMSTTATPYWVDFARRLRAAGFDGHLLFGGTFATMRPDELLRTAPEVDAVVVGEGDITIPAYAAALAAGTSSETLGGIVTRGGSPRPVAARPGSECQPDWSLLAEDLADYGIDELLFLGDGPARVRPVAPVLTARGCPYQCTFCPTPAFFGAGFSTADVGATLDHVESLVTAHGIRALSVWDDTFTVKPARVRAFCEGLIERRLDVTWWCFGRSEWIGKHQDLLPLMARAGLRMMWLGVESSDDQTLAEYARLKTAGTAEYAVQALVSEGVLPTTSFIVGHPDTTPQSLAHEHERSMRFYDLGSVNVYTLMIPLPGTPLFESLRDRQLLATDDLRLYGGTRAVLDYPQIERAAVEEHFYRAYAGSILGDRFLGHVGRVNLWDSGVPASHHPQRDALHAGYQREVQRMRALEHAERPPSSACFHPRRTAP